MTYDRRMKVAGGHDAKGTYDWLEKARENMAGIGADAYVALEQVARFSDVPEAARFAKALRDRLVEMEKLIEIYLHNNRDLTRPPPRV
jgi:hypothetical protein